MHSFTICLAEKIFNITTQHTYTQQLCADYLSPQTPDYKITISQQDIDQERERSAASDLAEGHKVRPFTDDYLESLAVYRKIAEVLVEDNVLLFHGSAVAVDGIGYLFTAKSGTGKSTHTRLWREVFGERAVMVNDDKPLLRIMQDGSVRVYGTPWDGKHRLSRNLSVPLRAIAILRRCDEAHPENQIWPITKREAYAMLVQQSYHPKTPSGMTKALQLVEQISNALPLYELHCRIDPQAALIAYQTMNQSKSIGGIQI